MSTSEFLQQVGASQEPLFIPTCTSDSRGLFDDPQVSLLYYDIETTGLNEWHDRIVQFAAIRRGLADGVHRSEFETLVRPAADTSIAAGALATHGITLDSAADEGVSEPELASLVHRAMCYRQTVSVGFNSTGFDSRFVRALMYRNFFPAYLHEWADGCSQWDLLPAVRTFLALVPNALQWVAKDGGGASLTLVDLAEAADIDFPDAHDALADSRTLAQLDTALRQRSEDVWRATFSRRVTRFVMRDIGSDWWPHLLLHVTGFVPAKDRCLAMVAPVAADPNRSNAGRVWDLRHDPSVLLDLSAQEIAQRFYAAGDARLPFFNVKANASPQIFPLQPEEAQTLVVTEQLDVVLRHLKILECIHDQIAGKMSDALRISGWSSDGEVPDVDAALYEGFMADPDLDAVNDARQQGPEALADLMRGGQFEDWRIPELLWRYVARHHPEQLTDGERDDWDRQVQDLLAAHDSRRAAEDRAREERALSRMEG